MTATTPYDVCRSSACIEEDEDGFYWVMCGCELAIGPAPDIEVATDMAMEHAWEMGRLAALHSGRSSAGGAA